MSCYDCVHGPDPCDRCETDGGWPGPVMLCQESKDYMKDILEDFSRPKLITKEEFERCELEAELELMELINKQHKQNL